MNFQDGIDFKTLENLFPQLKRAKEKKVVVVGYPYSGMAFCPYSVKAKNAIDSNDNLKNNHTFIQIPFGSNERQSLTRAGYNGSMPIVMLNQNGKFRHLGGGSELLNAVNMKQI